MKIFQPILNLFSRSKEPEEQQEEKSVRRTRILYQFLLVTLAVSVIPLLASSYKLVGINRTYLEDQLLALHSQVADSASEEISTALSTIMSNMELVSKAQSGNSPLNREERERSLIFYLDQYPEIIRLTQYSTGGREMARVFRVGRSKVPSLREDMKKLAVQESTGGKTFVSDPVVLPGSEIPIVAVGMPVYGNDGSISSMLLGRKKLS